MRILLTEDDDVLSDGISVALQQGGYSVERARNGLEATHFVSAHDFDLMILDLGLPGLDGFSVLREVRSNKQGKAYMPVLILTARESLDDRVTGLDLGADDYMTKPFDLPELEARVRVLLRRNRSSAGNEIILGLLKLDTVARRVTIANEPVELSLRELTLLELLLSRLGRVVTKEQVLEQVWGLDDEVSSNAIEVNMHRLRKKLEPAGVNIRTIRGLGYLVERPS